MTFEKDLQAKKADALVEYKAAKADFLATVTKDNIKGDFSKWKIFCEKKLLVCVLVLFCKQDLELFRGSIPRLAFWYTFAERYKRWTQNRTTDGTTVESLKSQ